MILDTLESLRLENRKLRRSVLVDKIAMTFTVLAVGLACRLALDMICKLLEAIP